MVSFISVTAKSKRFAEHLDPARVVIPYHALQITRQTKHKTIVKNKKSDF